jgi:hypothetical protein
MKKLLVLTALGLFLAGGAAVAVMTVYPHAAMAGCTSVGC